MKKNKLIILICIGLFLASISNGAVSYLKRIGLHERHQYEAFMAVHCDYPGIRSDLRGTRCWCMREPFPRQADPSRGIADEPEDDLSIYRDTGRERWLKVAKDALFVSFVLLSLYSIRSGKSVLPSLADSWPALLVASDVVLGFAISYALWPSSFALLGLRSFEFLAIVLLGGWVVGGLSRIAGLVGGLLAFQAALVVPELMLGLPLRTCPDTFRAAGTMVLSNSLGIFTVVALAFYASFSEKKRHLLGIVLVSIFLVAASGSGTGLIVLFVMCGAFLLGRLSGPSRRIAVVALVLLATAMLGNLPALTQRPNIYDSVLAKDGRAGKLMDVLRQSSPAEILFGHGVGYGTNTAANLVAGNGVLLAPGNAPKPFSADSTVIVLLTQLGIIGIAAFYWLLGWAYWRDPKARLIYLVMALASLTINITELFPVNFLLGLALAHTIMTSRVTRSGATPS